MTVGAGELDVGTAYGRGTPEPDRRLAEVGSGTPMGELLRRFWQPVAVTPAPGSRGTGPVAT